MNMRVKLATLVAIAWPVVTGAQAPSIAPVHAAPLPPIGLPLPRIGLPLPPIGLPAPETAAEIDAPPVRHRRHGAAGHHAPVIILVPGYGWGYSPSPAP